MVLLFVPNAQILGEVRVKTLGSQGRAFGSGKFTRSDLSIDLLVKGSRGVFCAIEVHGPEHWYGQGPDRDRKKQEHLARLHVPLVVLSLTRGRKVPRADWEDILSHHHQVGDLS